MITPKEAYEQSMISRKEIMGRFENDNPAIIEILEQAIDLGVADGHKYIEFKLPKKYENKDTDIRAYLQFLGYTVLSNLSANSFTISWSSFAE